MMNVHRLENTHEITGRLCIGLFSAGMRGELYRNRHRRPFDNPAILEKSTPGKEMISGA
jgi:hypothetical protein